jgi:hypothetical protein
MWATWQQIGQASTEPGPSTCHQAAPVARSAIPAKAATKAARRSDRMRRGALIVEGSIIFKISPWRAILSCNDNRVTNAGKSADPGSKYADGPKEPTNTSWHEIGWSFQDPVLTKRRGLSRAVLPLTQFWFRLNLPLCNEESDLMAVPFGPRFG